MCENSPNVHALFGMFFAKCSVPIIRVKFWFLCWFRGTYPLLLSTINHVFFLQISFWLSGGLPIFSNAWLQNLVNFLNFSFSKTILFLWWAPNCICGQYIFIFHTALINKDPYWKQHRYDFEKYNEIKWWYWGHFGLGSVQVLHKHIFKVGFIFWLCQTI